MLVQRVFDQNAIGLIVAVGLLSVVAFRIITAIQGSEFTFHMAWDVIYGLVLPRTKVFGHPSKVSII